MKLTAFRDLLTAHVNGAYPVKHLFMLKANYPYLRWAEIRRTSQYGDNNVDKLAWEVVLDYWTKTDFDPNVDDLIEWVSNDPRLTFVEHTVASNTDTGVILHEITIKVI